MRGTHDLETRQHALSAVGSSCRWSTIRSSISGGRERDIVVSLKEGTHTTRAFPPPRPATTFCPMTSLITPSHPLFFMWCVHPVFKLCPSNLCPLWDWNARGVPASLLSLLPPSSGVFPTVPPTRVGLRPGSGIPTLADRASSAVGLIDVGLLAMLRYPGMANW